MATTAGYGRWDSPIAAADVAAGQGVPLGSLLRRRRALLARVAARRGRSRGPGAAPTRTAVADHSPPAVSIRSRVHEYGGGAVCLVPGRAAGAFAYVDQADQRVWFCDGAGGRGAPVGHAARADGGAARGRGPQSRRAQRDGRRGLGRRRARGRTGRAWRARAQRRRALDPAVSRALPVHAPRRTRLLRAAPGRRGGDAPGGGRVGPPRHALGRVGRPGGAALAAVDAAPAAPRSQRRARRGRSRAGRASRWASRRWGRDGTPALRLGPRRVVAALRPPGVPATGRGGPRLQAERPRGRVPRARLGPRAVDHGRAGRRQPRRPRDGVGAATPWSGSPPGAPASTPPDTLAATLRLRRRGVRPPRGRGGHRDDARTRRANVWLCAAGAAPAPLRPAAGEGPRPPRRGDGRALPLRGRSGAARARQRSTAPPSAGAQGPAGTAPPLVTWCHGGPTSSCQPGLDLTLQFFTTPRLRRCLCRLRGQRRATAGPIAAPSGASGAWPTPRTASTRRCTWPAGRRRPAAHGGAGQQRRRHDRPERAGLGGGVRRLCVLVRGDGPDGPRRHDPRLRGALHRPADRPVAPGRTSCTRSVRR